MCRAAWTSQGAGARAGAGSAITWRTAGDAGRVAVDEAGRPLSAITERKGDRIRTSFYLPGEGCGAFPEAYLLTMNYYL